MEDKAAASSWRIRRTKDARSTEAGDGRRVATRASAARQNRGREERRRLTGGPGEGFFLFLSFFSLGCEIISNNNTYAFLYINLTDMCTYKLSYLGASLLVSVYISYMHIH